MKVTVTQEFLASAKTAKGGYTRAQLDIFGIGWPPPKGWPALLIGREVEQEQLDQFMKARSPAASPARRF